MNRSAETCGCRLFYPEGYDLMLPAGQLATDYVYGAFAGLDNDYPGLEISLDDIEAEIGVCRNEGLTVITTHELCHALCTLLCQAICRQDDERRAHGA